MRIKPTPTQIKRWVDKHFSDHKFAKRGEEIRINNPLSIDTDYHLWINTEKAIVNDFRPQYKGICGTFLSFVKKYKECSFREAVEEVMGSNVDFNATYDDVYIYNKREEVVEHVDLPKNFELLDGSDDSISQMVRNYLHSRRITDEQITDYKIGSDGFGVVTPYYEYDELVYWQSRSIYSKVFDFPSSSNKSKFIYGIDLLEFNGHAVVTESIFNSLMFKYGVAIGGSSMSIEQKRLLKSFDVSKLIIAFDGDEAGRHGAAECYKLLKNDFELYYSFPTDDRDWNKIAQDDSVSAARDMLRSNIKKLDFNASIKLKLS